MRPIYAEEVIEKINELESSPWYLNYANKFEFLARKEALETVRDLCVRSAKTVDPVKHGHWIAKNKDLRWMTDVFECSSCRRPTVLGVYDITCDYEYCPHCGARMDEKVEE